MSSQTTTPPPSANANTPNQYLRTQVLTASPEQLRLMLLEGAVRFTRQARDGLAAKDHEAIYTGFSKARDIVVELMTAIKSDADPTLRSNVQGLYAYIFKLLVDASFEKDGAKAEEAAKLLEYECETWKLAMEKIKSERTQGAIRPAAMSMAGERPALSVQG